MFFAAPLYHACFFQPARKKGRARRRCGEGLVSLKNILYIIFFFTSRVFVCSAGPQSRAWSRESCGAGLFSFVCVSFFPHVQQCFILSFFLYTFSQHGKLTGCAVARKGQHLMKQLLSEQKREEKKKKEEEKKKKEALQKLLAKLN